MGHTGGSKFLILRQTHRQAHQAMNNVQFGRLMGALALVVIASVACASPAGISPGDATPAVSAPPTTLSEPVTAREETARSDPEATPEQSGTDVADVQALQRIAVASVQLDVDAFPRSSVVVEEDSEEDDDDDDD